MSGRTSLYLLLLCLYVRFGYALEVQEVRLVGLFKDTAVIQVKGKQRLLKLGQVSPEGVKLIATSSGGAVVLIEGAQYQLSLARAMTGSYTKKQALSHAIAINHAGQYFTAGSINGQPVQFLVDTGATSVALNTVQARRLGIDFAAGQLEQVGTAGGIVKAYAVTLARVKVGAIEVKNVRASILEGVYPVNALLGMTYLRHVEIAEDNGVMTLTQKY